MTEYQIVVFTLVLTRVSTFVAFFPLFSKRQLPHMVKIGLAVGLSFFWYSEIEHAAKQKLENEKPTARFSISDDMSQSSEPGFSAQSPATGKLNLGTINSFLLIAKEFAIGLMLAIVTGIFLLPAKVAGAYFGQEMGLSIASLSDPASADQSNLVARIFESFTILIFFAVNLHHFLILVVDSTFKQLAGKIDPMNLPTEQIVEMLNSVADYGLLVVAPLAILTMLVTLALALLNKAAPTLNLFTIGMSLRAGFGLFCVLMLAPVIFGSFRGYLYRIQHDIEQLLVTFLYS